VSTVAESQIEDIVPP